MKIQTLAVAAGVGVPLILTGSVQAGFTGISTASKPNPFGLLVVNVYAEFDRPGEDDMTTVFGLAASPMTIEVIGGTFYQHPFGTDRAPFGNLVAVFPSLAFDSFVTIGVKQLGGKGGQPEDQLWLLPGWPGFGASTLLLVNAGYSITPNNPQGNPFDPVNSFPGDGRVLIGQFSTADGGAIRGTMGLSYRSNSVAIDTFETFFHVPGPGALAMMGMAGLIGTRRRRRHRRE